MDLMYILGEPGSGKSTLMAALIDETPYDILVKPFMHLIFENEVRMLGGIRKGYPGTDMLALDASPKVLKWLRDTKPALVMGEGARLGTYSFLHSARVIGYELHLYHMVSPDARAMRQQREQPQKESFAKGQKTKSANLAAEMGALDISPTMPADFLKHLLNDPVSAQFE